jgi:hypothetical protein
MVKLNMSIHKYSSILYYTLFRQGAIPLIYPNGNHPVTFILIPCNSKKLTALAKLISPDTAAKNISLIYIKTTINHIDGLQSKNLSRLYFLGFYQMRIKDKPH